MKKLTAVSFFLMVGTILAQAQDDAVIRNDTAYYKGLSFHKGQIIKIGYGSNVNKQYAFCYLGGVNTITPADLTPRYANREYPLLEVIKKKGKVYVTLETRYMGALQRITCDLQGAVDFNEIR